MQLIVETWWSKLADKPDGVYPTTVLKSMKLHDTVAYRTTETPEAFDRRMRKHPLLSRMEGDAAVLAIPNRSYGIKEVQRLYLDTDDRICQDCGAVARPSDGRLALWECECGGAW